MTRGGAGYMGLTDQDFADWIRRVEARTASITREEGVALIQEVVRLRRVIRRQEEQLTAALQQPLFKD